MPFAFNCGNFSVQLLNNVDFLAAVNAVVRWVETNSNWDETLVILTADHETGLIWGPNSASVAFDPIVDHGKGNLPGMKYNYKSHSNSLVPLYARGPGSQRFEKLLRGTDRTAAAKFGFPGRYVENTTVAAVVKASIATTAEPVKVSRGTIRGALTVPFGSATITRSPLLSLAP